MPMFSYNKHSYERRLTKILELNFLTLAKRNKLIATWAATKLGLQSKNKQKYIRNILVFSLLYPKTSKVVDYIKKDFEQASLSVTRKDIEREINNISKEIKVE